MLYNLHFLRILAALCVVYYHTASSSGLNLKYCVGSYGVDIFFVISGFIITHVGHGSPYRFLLRRLIRIVPFYWLATLFVFAIALVQPHLLRSTRADFIHLFCSLLFIPYPTPHAGIMPTLLLGWSLNFEVFFYLIFSISLLWSKLSPSLLCGSFIALIWGAIHLFPVSSPSMAFYGSPMIFEFIYGIGTYHALVWWQAKTRTQPRSPLGIAFFVALGLLSFASLLIAEYHRGFGFSRSLSGGLPALFIVMSALILERVFKVYTRHPTLLLLAESSYVLYLIHPYLIYPCLRLALPGLNLQKSQGHLLGLVLLALCLAAAAIVHKLIEKPLLNHLRKVWRVP